MWFLRQSSKKEVFTILVFSVLRYCLSVGALQPWCIFTYHCKNPFVSAIDFESCYASLRFCLCAWVMSDCVTAVYLIIASVCSKKKVSVEVWQITLAFVTACASMSRFSTYVLCMQALSSQPVSLGTHSLPARSEGRSQGLELAHGWPASMLKTMQLPASLDSGFKGSKTYLFTKINKFLVQT